MAPLTAKLGDVDLDGSITPVDSRLALRYVNGMEELSPTAKYVADANRSGDISTFDAEYILKMYTGSCIISFPKGAVIFTAPF